MLTIFMIWLTENRAAFQVMWEQRWFRLLFWIAVIITFGSIARER